MPDNKLFGNLQRFARRVACCIGTGPRAKQGPLPACMQGFLVFQHTGEAIMAERLLQESGFAAEIKGPPPTLTEGCDMVIVFDLLREPAIMNALRLCNVEPLLTVPIENPQLEPVSLYQFTDYGDWFMVRAANMKITLEKATGTIVNVSGGGCPDVPHMAALLIGRHINEAEEPRFRGQTLCAYSLQQAFREARRVWAG